MRSVPITLCHPLSTRRSTLKVTVPLAALLLAAAIGYILGTESGRAQRDDLLVRLGLGRGDAADPGAGDDTMP
jgi:hypothetical protein